MVENLCLQTDVSSMIDIVGRYTSTAIGDEIYEQTDFLYADYGEPLAAMVSGVDRDENDDFYKDFYVGERNIYRIDKVFIGTATKREISTAYYTSSVSNGFIKLTSATTVGGENIDDSDEVMIWYVPGRFRKLCAVKVAEKLLERSDTMSGDKTSKELSVVQKRKKEYEDLITNKNEMQLASQYEFYNEFYDTNLVKFPQDFKKNKVLNL